VNLLLLAAHFVMFVILLVLYFVVFVLCVVGREVYIEDMSKCMYCKECVKKAESSGFRKPEMVEIIAKQDRFHFSVETNGSLPPEAVVITALEVLQKKLADLQTEINTTIKRE